MTEKQKKILTIALAQFATVGFYATSTNKIARLAGVSEGLIFRHFTNKDGLLKAILAQGEEEINTLFAPLFTCEDPKELLRSLLAIPFRVSPEQYNYWRLLYTLKWQERAYNEISLESVMELAREAFAKLGYADPAAEVVVLEMILDGAATVILLSENELKKEETLNALKAKYNL